MEKCQCMPVRKSRHADIKGNECIKLNEVNMAFPPGMEDVRQDSFGRLRKPPPTRLQMLSPRYAPSLASCPRQERHRRTPSPRRAERSGKQDRAEGAFGSEVGRATGSGLEH